MPLIQDEDIAQLLRETDTIAMIGISDNPTRPSYGVMAFLQEQGHRVIPVNPQIAGEHVHGEFEIGSASCRERVCQYVWYPVVHVTLKKKSTEAEQRRTTS